MALLVVRAIVETYTNTHGKKMERLRTGEDVMTKMTVLKELKGRQLIA
jgi:hypothetical protein